MLYLKQKYIHIPRKQSGDCWRTAIASLIECDVEEFPYWKIGTSWNKHFDKVISKLEELGYKYEWFYPNYSMEEDIYKDAYGGILIAIGKSPRSTKNNKFYHAVLWKEGIIHDPHPDNTGILSIEYFERITKIK